MYIVDPAKNHRMLHMFHEHAPTPIESRLEDRIYLLKFALRDPAVTGDE